MKYCFYTIGVYHAKAWQVYAWSEMTPKELLSRHPVSYQEDVEGVTPKAQPPIKKIEYLYIFWLVKKVQDIM